MPPGIPGQVFFGFFRIPGAERAAGKRGIIGRQVE